MTAQIVDGVESRGLNGPCPAQENQSARPSTVIFQAAHVFLNGMRPRAACSEHCSGRCLPFATHRKTEHAHTLMQTRSLCARTHVRHHHSGGQVCILCPVRELVEGRTTIPTAQLPCLTASIAYSTWKRRPWGLQVVISVSYCSDTGRVRQCYRGLILRQTTSFQEVHH